MSLLDALSALGKDTIAYALIILAATVVGQLVLSSRKIKGNREIAKITAEEALQRHNSEISIQLLDQLRKELARALTENERLNPYVDRARNLTRHINAILLASTPVARAYAEEQARAYLASIDED